MKVNLSKERKRSLKHKIDKYDIISYLYGALLAILIVAPNLISILSKEEIYLEAIVKDVASDYIDLESDKLVNGDYNSNNYYVILSYDNKDFKIYSYEAYKYCKDKIEKSVKCIYNPSIKKITKIIIK